jgi:CheY-like chemotaxis protein
VPRFKLLVVEDFPGFQEFVCNELRKNADFDVYAVADGLAAVEQALQLRPDLILLDIGLPKLNGIEAAERIRALCPHSKIVFLSQESSPDVVQAGLDIGAHGYIYKLHAHGCLLAAVEAILDGKSPAGTALGANNRHGASPHRHLVHFYSDDTILVDNLERFVAAALNAHDAAIVFATRPHVAELLQRMKAGGVNVDGAIADNTLRLFDAREVLAHVMSDELPDCDLFGKLLSEVVASAAMATKQPDPRVAIFGECVALLCAADNVDAAIRLEQTGNELLSQCVTPRLDIMCGYPLPHSALRRVCAEHSVVAVA